MYYCISVLLIDTFVSIFIISGHSSYHVVSLKQGHNSNVHWSGYQRGLLTRICLVMINIDLTYTEWDRTLLAMITFILYSSMYVSLFHFSPKTTWPIWRKISMAHCYDKVQLIMVSDLCIIQHNKFKIAIPLLFHDFDCYFPIKTFRTFHFFLIQGK